MCLWRGGGGVFVELAIVPRAKRSGPEIHTQPVVVTVLQPDPSSTLIMIMKYLLSTNL